MQIAPLSVTFGRLGGKLPTTCKRHCTIDADENILAKYERAISIGQIVLVIAGVENAWHDYSPPPVRRARVCMHA
jgi:hypothetical protein